MAIEKYSLGHCPNWIEEDAFTADMGSVFRRIDDAKIVFIHSPRVKNLLQTEIDLLLVIAIQQKSDHYHLIGKKGEHCYFKNLIIPIKFLHEDFDKKIQVQASQIAKKPDFNISLNIDDIMEEDYLDELKSLAYQTKKYLIPILDPEREKPKFNVHPLVWILNDKNYHILHFSHCLVSPRFSFENFNKYLIRNSTYFFNSVKEWANYELCEEHIQNLLTEVEKDGKIGKLTKKKIDRISKQYHEDLRIYEKYIAQKEQDKPFELGAKTEKKKTLPTRIKAEKGLSDHVVIISGKAGSGKTSELMLLVEKCYQNKKSVRYITYNKLLSYEAEIMASKIKATNPQTSSITVRTIHKLFWKMSDSWAILRIMSEKRHNKLNNQLDTNQKYLTSIIEQLGDNTSTEQLIAPYHLDTLSVTAREYIRSFKHYADREFQEKKLSKNKLSEYSGYYYRKKAQQIQSMLNKEVFLQDYYGVLENIKLFWKKGLDGFLDSNNLSKEKFQKTLIEMVIEKTPRGYSLPESKAYLNETGGSEKFIKMSKGGFGRYITIIDEGQDFHPLERDILFLMNGGKNTIVATGGREQLIRHSEVCQWHLSDEGKPLNVIELKKRNKTFRMKENIVKLCNYIANKYEIDLKLEIEKNTSDSGRVVIEPQAVSDEKLQTRYNELYAQGKEQGLSNYESIMFLLESNSKDFFEKSPEYTTSQVDDKGNVRETSTANIKKFSLPNILEIPDRIWTHNIEQVISGDEDEDAPEHQKHRAIFYESCRGVEAWSVMCFGIDTFFERKKQEENAALYRSDDLLLSEEQRRNQYAATWVLMALTRAMDTLYIQVDDIKSDFGKMISEYIEKL